MALLGIDLGATKLACAAFTEDGSMISEDISILGGRKGTEVGEMLRDRMDAMLDARAAVGDSVTAIGVCVPGISRKRSGTVWAPNIPGWEDYPLLAELQTAAGGIPIAIDSDRACYILGEVWQGAAQGCSDAIFLAVGTGIGAGIMTDGVVLRGTNDSAGAIGWMALERPYAAKFDECGNFETHASGGGIPKLAAEIIAELPGYGGELKGKSFEAADVFCALENGDAVAERALARCVELWGMAAANLVSLFNPEKIIFGGGVFGPAIRFLPEIYAEARKWAQPVGIKNVLFEPSSLGNHAGVFGAAYLAMQNADEK